MLQIRIIDDFFDKDDIDNILININKKEQNKITVFHNVINFNGEILQSTLDHSLIKRLHRKYHNKAMGILNDISPKKSEIYEYSDFTIIITGKDKKFPIHDDTPDKLLSGVIYLHPKKNNGTIFYENKKGKNKKNINWKINRGIFFSRIENQSWHSYEGDGVSDRITLVYNLKTSKIKKVYEIENKNYLKGFIRWKINPYIYKIFGITI